MKLLAILGAIIFICFYTSTSSADIYSWTDESGITHFTNNSPPPAARLVLKDIPFPRRALPDKESEDKGQLLREGSEIKQDLDQAKIQAKRKKAQALEEAPYSSENAYPDANGSDKSKNAYASDYPPGFHRYPPELQSLKHHPNYHYKYHLDKPYGKKTHSAFRHKRHNYKPTIWDRNPRNHKNHKTDLHRKRVFGWQPPKAKNRPSAHYFAFGGGHYRGTSIRARGHWAGRASAFGGKGRFGGHGRR
jgi:hypothetical protein